MGDYMNKDSQIANLRFKVRDLEAECTVLRERAERAERRARDAEDILRKMDEACRPEMEPLGPDRLSKQDRLERLSRALEHVSKAVNTALALTAGLPIPVYANIAAARSRLDDANSPYRDGRYNRLLYVLRGVLTSVMRAACAVETASAAGAAVASAEATAIEVVEAAMAVTEVE